MQVKFEKKKVVKIMVIAGVIVLVLAGGGVAIAGKLKTGQAVAAGVADTNRSYEVKKGTISTTVSATGTLEADDVQNMDVLSLLTVDKVYVEAGDTVEKGDLLATVDTVSVKSALQTLQSELESLDSQIEDEKDEAVSTKIRSGVSGRVKKLYVTKGDGVTDVMQENGALALLSLDGKMAVDVETSETLNVGDEVTVTLSDGSVVDGTVDAVSGTKVTVTMTDNGPAYEEAVTVSRDGKTLGSGTLYIHSELTVTGYTGTVSSVAVKENQKVSDGTVLFKLKNTGKTAAYEKLVAERAEVADALSQVVALYQDPNLYAEFSGTVQSVNCEDAEVVKTESADAEGTTDTDAAEAAQSTADTDNTKTAENSAAANRTEDTEKTTGSIESSKVNKTAAVSGTVYDAESALKSVKSSGGFVSLGTTSSVSGGIVQVSADQGTAAAQSTDNSTTSENNTQSVSAGDTNTAGNTSTGSSTGDTSSSAENGKENGSETSGSPESSGNAGSSETAEDGKQDNVLSSLQTVIISTPVAGNTVQKTINSGTGYTAKLSWSPAVTEKYSEKTAYTATLTFSAADGYCFDGKLAETYLQAVSADQAQTKAEVSADGKTLTVTAVFPDTQESTQTDSQSNRNTQQTINGKTAGSGGGSMAGSAVSGYSMSSKTSASVSESSDTETVQEEQNELAKTTTIFTISTDEKMKVSVSVDEQDILNLSAGQTAEVTLDAVDGETFEGTVTAVHTASGEASNGVTKYTADVTLDKTEQMLQGMNASVVVTISSAEDCLMIPEAALQENGKTTTVYTSYDEATGTYGGETEVTTGVSDGTSVEILSGLSEGDTIYYSYTESSSDMMNAMPDMGGMQMPAGDGQKMDGQGKADGNRPDGAPGGRQ